MTGRKLKSLILLIPFFCLLTAASASAELTRLHVADFPCDTVPPKCPSLVNFVLQLAKVFNGGEIRLDINQQIDIDFGLCGALYILAGGTIVIPAARDDLNAEFFMDGNPESDFYDDLAIRIQITNVSLEGPATLVGEDCLIFFDFELPLATNISVDTILMESRTSVWLDTVTDKVVLQDVFSDAAFGGVHIEGLPEGLSGIADTIAILLAEGVLAPLADSLLLEEGGIVFNLAQTLMNKLYHTKPCGGCMAPPHVTGTARVSHIFANMFLYLIPAGLILVLRRRNKK